MTIPRRIQMIHIIVVLLVLFLGLTANGQQAFRKTWQFDTGG